MLFKAWNWMLAMKVQWKPYGTLWPNNCNFAKKAFHLKECS